MKKSFKMHVVGLLMLVLTFYSLLSHAAETQEKVVNCSKAFSESCRQSFKPKGTVKKCIIIHR